MSVFGSSRMSGSRGTTYGRSRRGEEDQSTEVSSTLVGESASGIDEGTDTVGLDGRAGDGATPGGGGTGSLLRLEELLGGVGALSAAVGITEERAKDGERDGVGVGGTDGNGRRLDRGKVCMKRMKSVFLSSFSFSRPVARSLVLAGGTCWNASRRPPGKLEE